ncbi:MAG: ATP-binding cassette domain-containing protein, partial [Deltaproteobacteria bacterium]|nr:ATP-binding cassette domain-containing protein [Deltaproteobacteria bacterium]
MSLPERVFRFFCFCMTGFKKISFSGDDAPKQMPEPFIIVKSLTKTFGSGAKATEVLKGIDFTVYPGEIFGIGGLSGAGKSTLIRCLNRLEEPTSGEIIIDGLDFQSFSQKWLRIARMEMGMIFQSFNLLSSRTTFGNVAFPLEVAGYKKAAISARVAELL